MAAVFVLFWGRGDNFVEVDVPAPARVCDVRKALREPFQLSGLQVARTELRVVAAGGPQPAPSAVSAALAAPRAALDASAPLGSPAAGFGAGAWLVAREVAPQHVAPAAGGGAALSATAMVGPTFEAEARAALEAVLPEVFPWLRSHSRLVSRQLELPAEGTREADLLCYTDADSLQPSVSSAVHGVRLIELGDGVVTPPREALPIPAGLGFSPADRERSGPHKYILGQAYCGAQGSAMEAKVRQLDTLVSFMLRRWNDRSPASGAGDVTQLVGAGVLVFCAGTKPRRQVLDGAAALVARVVAGAGCPSLRRLAHAGRLVVMVLEQAQCPLTTSQRAVAERLDHLAAIVEDCTAAAEKSAAVAEKTSEQIENLTELVSALGGGGGGRG